MVVCLAAAGVSLAAAPRESALALRSSDSRLVEAFQWAKGQALAYVFDGDPVGPWYEAALPGRQAFCMRDVSHQAAGAHALGLTAQNYNMLRRFAENIAASRDWCSYWEINRENKPAPVDYESDASFWYDLPANFDVLDACWRMYQWTGDRRYIDDPVFRNFYDRTVRDYVERWQLGPDRVMQRQRPMPPPGAPRFQRSRGIPSYIEGRGWFVLGLDLLAIEYAGFRAYSQMAGVRKDAIAEREFSQKAIELKKLIDDAWWDPAAHRFHSMLSPDYKFIDADNFGLGDRAMLYYGAALDGPEAQTALDHLVEKAKGQPGPNVEEESHYAEIFYRYGRPDAAYATILDLTRADKQRREYPEVSYSVIGAIVTGMMGVRAEADGTVWTRPSLVAQTQWAEIANLPVRSNVITVRHEGKVSTTLTNQSGPALTWAAAFPGSYATLRVDGKTVPAEKANGQPYTFVHVTVAPGAAVRVTSLRP